MNTADSPCLWSLLGWFKYYSDDSYLTGKQNVGRK